MRTVAVYVRTSTDMQATGLESQVRAVKAYCEANGMNEHEVFADEGVSGAQVHRKALDRLIARVEAGEISAVVVYSFSRFARSVKHLLEALELFERHQVAFISVSENLDTRSSTGRFVFTILAALGALEREILIDRVKCGIANAKAKGKTLGRPKKRNDELIRALRLQGLTYSEIANLARCSKWSVHQSLKETRLEKVGA